MINVYKYIKNIAEDEATILLYGQIGDSIDSNGNINYGISGSSFAYELQYLQSQTKRIKVRINSIGGSVLDGYSIVSAILNSSVPVDTYIDGLAASTAGFIAIAGKKCYMMDYGTMMLHNPSGGEREVLDLVKNTITTIYSNRTSKTAEEISEMMDKETWLSATEAVNMGLVDEVIPSTKKIKIKKESLQDLALVYNKLIENKKQMIEVTNILKLKNEASEQEIVSAISAKDEALKVANEENEALKAKVAEYEAKELEAKNAAELALKEKATALVNKAEEDKKITKEEVPAYIEKAIADFSFIENTLSKIPTVKTATKVFDPKNVVTKVGAEDRSAWNIREWETKDPSGLAKMKNETPEAYNELFNTYYKSKK